ncbi:MAG: UDP-N-acetylmuramoyl-L-alanyl-D-glutamate--2,6-diaminopimelate ligase [Alphaproteobacteria bacterium]
MTGSAKEFRGLAADSRDVRPGFLFAALSGGKADGVRYIADAAERGAAAVLGPPDAAEAARAAGVRFIPDKNPRLRLAKIAAEFYRLQPDVVAAVTGTNGKTSATVFLRQIWSSLGKNAASVGTIGIVSPAGEKPLSQTTPDPIGLHAGLAELKRSGVTHLAMEASSHGLDQYRLDGVRIRAAAFTNITRDHLDYHPTQEHYLTTKLRLFREIVEPRGLAVVNADADNADQFASAARQRKLRVITVGRSGDDLRIMDHTVEPHGQRVRVLFDRSKYDLHLPLAGMFQVSNALVAGALAIGLGDPADKVFAALKNLKGAPGRMQLVARAQSGAPIYIDYAHTPDALETVLLAVRPHVKGKLHLVFGCGGDRDRGKRPLMGAAARKHADTVIVTDDNPRSEDPAAIRREALKGCPGAREIGDRAHAIREAIAGLGEGDVLVIAGKGHEEGQTIGDETRPFSDRGEAIKAARSLGGEAAGDGL